MEALLIIDPQFQSFTIHFHFEPNKFFTNELLTKKYSIKCEPDNEDPITFQGSQVLKAEGTKIDWKPDQDLTTKNSRKRFNSDGTFELLNVKSGSFFDFFKSREMPKDEEDEEIRVSQ